MNPCHPGEGSPEALQWALFGLLSGLIFFINNLEDDIEVNFIKSVGDTKAEEIVNTRERLYIF